MPELIQKEKAFHFFFFFTENVVFGFCIWVFLG